MARTLRGLRIDMNKTQAEIAEEVGLSMFKYRRIELGQLDKVPVAEFKKVADALNISMQELLQLVEGEQ